MSHSGPSAVRIVLSDEERAELVRRAGVPGRWRADRARIILACAEGMSNAAAAQALGVAVKSVSKWRRQFAAERLAGLEDAAPVGRRQAGLVLEEARAGPADAVGPAGEDRPVPGVAGEDRAALRGGRDEQAGRRRSGRG